MSNVIGQIVVDLMARTASFEAGMSAGSKIAQKTGKEIERAFEDIGSTAEKILGGISPLAGEWGAALAAIGGTARTLLGELGPLAGVLRVGGPIALGLAGIAAVAGAASIAALGLAARTAEEAAKLGELSQRTAKLRRRPSKPTRKLKRTRKFNSCGIRRSMKGSRTQSNSRAHGTRPFRYCRVRPNGSRPSRPSWKIRKPSMSSTPK